MSESRSEDGFMSESQSAGPVVPPIEAEAAKSAGSGRTRPSRGKRVLRTVAFIILPILLILGVGGYFLVSQANKSRDLSQIQGKVALSQSELRDLVVSKKLTVYWAGPMAGAKYTLTANTPGAAYVKYLPGGVGLNDTKTLFRVVGTYTQKNAFAVAQASRAVPGNLGFINADGNVVFYSSSRPTNVYIGIKGKDIQIEVFDPVAGQSLGLVLIRNQIRQII